MWVGLFVVAAMIRLPFVLQVGPNEGGGDEWYTAWRSWSVLFERGNLDSLAKTISLVANDNALRECIGRSALTSVASHALERMAVEYDRVFRQIVASHQPGLFM